MKCYNHVFLKLSTSHHSPLIGQCVQLGLRDTRLDPRFLLLRLHTNSNPRGLPGRPLWTQVADGLWNPGNSIVYTAHPCGCWPGCKLPYRCQGDGGDRRGRRSSCLILKSGQHMCVYCAPVNRGDVSIGLSQIYQYHSICCSTWTDMKTFQINILYLKYIISLFYNHL